MLGAGGRAPLSPSETGHQTLDQYVQPAMGFPDFYRAMLCIRGTSHGPVSVRPSQVGVLLKRLNVGSHKQHHTIAQGL